MLLLTLSFSFEICILDRQEVDVMMICHDILGSIGGGHILENVTVKVEDIGVVSAEYLECLFYDLELVYIASSGLHMWLHCLVLVYA